MGAKHSCMCCGRTNKQDEGYKTNDVCIPPEEQQQIVQAAKEWKFEKKEMPPEPTPEPEDYERVEINQPEQNSGDAADRPETHIPEAASEPKQSFEETPDDAMEMKEPTTAPDNHFPEVQAPEASPRTASEETKTPEASPRTAITSSEEAKTPAMSPRMDDEQDATPKKITWKVVGGVGNGLLVRENEGLKSKELGRLSCGATVEEINRNGTRLRYQKLTGEGPTNGWITTIVNGKPMLTSVWESSTV